MILVTGAGGLVGGEVAKALAARGLPVRAALRDPACAPPALEAAEPIRFDFTDEATHEAALAGVQALFLLRPPAMARPGAFRPFLEAARRQGVGHVAFLSVRGAERNPLLPHHGVERLVERSGLRHTHLRPNDFMQNFSTVHATDIRERSRILAPAGNGRASYVDVRDVAEAAAVILQDPAPHAGLGYTLTGPEALSLDEVAAILSRELGRQVVNARPGLARFIADRWRAGAPLPLTLVMGAVYTVQRLGLAAEVTPDLANLLRRRPADFASFARDHRECWL